MTNERIQRQYQNTVGYKKGKKDTKLVPLKQCKPRPKTKPESYIMEADGREAVAIKPLPKKSRKPINNQETVRRIDCGNSNEVGIVTRTSKPQGVSQNKKYTEAQRKAYNQNKTTRRGKIDFDKLPLPKPDESLLHREQFKISDLVKKELDSIIPNLPSHGTIIRESQYPKEFAKTRQELEEAKKKETWINLYGHEDTHMISSMGRVRSKGRTIQDKNGHYRTYQGKIYTADNKKEFLQFMIEGKTTLINLAQAIGDSFYGPGEKYSLVNGYDYYVEIDKPELYISLSNLNTNSKENRITIYDIKNDKEQVITGGLVNLLVFLNNGKTGDDKIFKEDLVSAITFEVDEDLGLILEGINKLPDVRLILRKGSAYSRLIELRARLDSLNRATILNDENMGRLYTAGEIKFGLEQIRNLSGKEYRYAHGMLRRYFWNPEKPLNDYAECVIICDKAKDSDNNDIKRYRIYQLRVIARYKNFKFQDQLHPEVIERVKDIAKNNEIIFGERNTFLDKEE